MIKLIIFDLDGVLVDARELHYNTLNAAIESVDKRYVITRAEHLSTYDGLSTRKKLDMLTSNKQLDVAHHNHIWLLKQKLTNQAIDKFTVDLRIQSILCTLKQYGYTIAVATNSIRSTALHQLTMKGFSSYVDFLYSNEDVKRPKPSTEMYLRCMIDADASPSETIIVEDSYIGRKAATRSGARLCAVINSLDLTLEKIMNTINNVNAQQSPQKWQSSTLKVLIPMAGAGSRFAQAGYTFPKPLIEVNGKPMIQTVVDNLNVEAEFIFIVQRDHYERYNLHNTLNHIAPNCKIVQADGVTQGAACTTLLAKEFIDCDTPLLIANSDQYVEWDSCEFMYAMVADGINGADGGIVTFESNHPKWSYAKLSTDGAVSQVAEKNPISTHATVGIYYWKRGSDYVRYAEQMIQKNIRTNNEFYVCPVFNEAIEDGKFIKSFGVSKMWGLGTPEDLQVYLQNNKN
jgi:HAD superfamily hydrolase (TIGR01509 family)